MKNAKLTKKEEEVMNHFWDNGALFVRELRLLYDEPRPHFNTLSTTVRGLQLRGYISHNDYGSTFQYFTTVSREQFNNMSLGNIIGKYYNNCAFSAVSSLVEEEKISLDDLKGLIDLIEKRK